ncbi:MAG: hypothetical protein J6Y97_14560, partial [Prevotella sp.]|nr:hypothetical protein [Prevotella sp.]
MLLTLQVKIQHRYTELQHFSLCHSNSVVEIAGDTLAGAEVTRTRKRQISFGFSLAGDTLADAEVTRTRKRQISFGFSLVYS